jgi:hypothetical protein
VHLYSTQDPALLLARGQKVFNIYMDFAEDRLDASPATALQKLGTHRTNVDNVNRAAERG